MTWIKAALVLPGSLFVKGGIGHPQVGVAADPVFGRANVGSRSESIQPDGVLAIGPILARYSTWSGSTYQPGPRSSWWSAAVIASLRIGPPSTIEKLGA